ncbi:PadR family transcriptional regulator [candidate division KSB1 bacterium]
MDFLTKLEELILISVWKLDENAYGTTIFKYIKDVTGKKMSLGGIYFPLERLTKRGYLNSFIGETTADRKGLSKRYYKLTQKGVEALNEVKRINEEMWNGYTEFPI